MTRAAGALIALAAACAGGPPEPAPAASERHPGAVAALVPREGLAYLAGRVLAEDAAFQTVRVTVARGHVQAPEGDGPDAGGGTVIHGPAEAEAPVESVRLEPEPDGAALAATIRLGPFAVRAPVLRRPRVGFPERCFVALTAAGGTASVRLRPAPAGAAGRLEAAGRAEVSPDGGEVRLDASCLPAVVEREEALSASLHEALADAIGVHAVRLAEAVADAAGPARPVGSGGLLRADLAPAAWPPGATAVRVRATGLVAVYDGAAEATPTRCAPTPEQTAPAPPAAARPPAPPLTAPGGAPYRLALAVEGAFLDRALAWAAAGGAPCADGGGAAAGPMPADLAYLAGGATLVTAAHPLRIRLRPAGGVATTLVPTAGALGHGPPLRLHMPALGLAVYGDVDGAPLALARLTADVTAAATVASDPAGALRLEVVDVQADGVAASPTVLPDGASGAAEAAPSLYRAALRHVLSGHHLPLAAWTERPADLVAVEATASHLIVYLDLR